MAEQTAQRVMTRQEIEARIVALAWEDETFLRAFLADPKREFEKRLGVSLPEALTITAHAEDQSHLHFVIPAKPQADIDELSDADLEKVAGGTDVISVTVMTAVSASVIGGGIAIGIESGW
jgi:hypothetical protein